MRKALSLVVAGAGVIAGAVTAMKVIDKKYRETIDRLKEDFEAEVEQTRVLRNVIRSLQKKNERLREEPALSEKEKFERERRDIVGVSGDVIESEKFVSYSKISDSESVRKELGIDPRPSPKEEIEQSNIYRISLEDYAENQGHQKSALNYYVIDDVLSMENGTMIDSRNQVIGPNALEMFGMDSEDDEIVYIRNDNVGVDYEVFRLEKSWAEEIAGVVELPYDE